MASCDSILCLQKINPRRRRRAAPRKVLVKFQKLRRLVPGGHRLRPDQLFLQTADYILHLKLKLDALETILKLHGP